MDDTTQVAADLVSDITPNTSLTKYVAGTIMVAGVYTVGKWVGGRRRAKKIEALNTVAAKPHFIDTTCR